MSRTGNYTANLIPISSARLLICRSCTLSKLVKVVGRNVLMCSVDDRVLYFKTKKLSERCQKGKW